MIYLLPGSLMKFIKMVLATRNCTNFTQLERIATVGAQGLSSPCTQGGIDESQTQRPANMTEDSQRDYNAHNFFCKFANIPAKFKQLKEHFLWPCARITSG
jgi:hypothetical protein